MRLVWIPDYCALFVTHVRYRWRDRAPSAVWSPDCNIRSAVVPDCNIRSAVCFHGSYEYEYEYEYGYVIQPIKHVQLPHMWVPDFRLLTSGLDI